MNRPDVPVLQTWEIAGEWGSLSDITKENVRSTF